MSTWEIAPCASLRDVIEASRPVKRRRRLRHGHQSTFSFSLSTPNNKYIMILTLSSEGVRNTVFMDEHGLPLFKSSTPFRLGVRTTTISRHMSNGSKTDDPMEVLGSIDWHCLGSSIFAVRETKLESNAFLPGHGFFGRKRTFIGFDGRRYRWDMYHRNVALSLDDGSGTEIARYHRATLGIIGKRRSAYLEIAPQAEHMLDLIVLTFIYVEKLRMDKERRQRRAAASGGGP